MSSLLRASLPPWLHGHAMVVGWALVASLLAATGCTGGRGEPVADPAVTGGGEGEGELPLCAIDSDCPPGTYCKGGRCDLDCRLPSDCGPAGGFDCVSGRCLPRGGACASDAQCAPPETICVAATCVPGCGVTGCGVGLVCDHERGRCTPEPDAGGGGCSRDQDCSPPDTVCDAGSCVPGCVSTGCSTGRVCDPGSGRCTPGCAADSDCSPPDTVCAGGSCVPGCGVTGCAAGSTCDPDTGRCVQAGCQGDEDCHGGKVCRDGLCVDPDPGCRDDRDCPEGTTCDRGSGGCVPIPGNLALGEACRAHQDCASGYCLQASVAGAAQAFCTRPCCMEQDCPWGQGCMYFSGVRVCVPARVMPPGFDFTASANQPCGPSGNSCRSGMCDVREDRCLATCCVDSDCGGLPCRWGPAGNTLRSYCDAAALVLGGPGEPCASGLDCMGGICLPDQASPLGGTCASRCCSEADCSMGRACVQITWERGATGPQGAVVYGCVDVPRGALPLGEGCATDSQCRSGMCVEGRCSMACCDEADCPAGFDCTLASNGEGGLTRACLER